MPSKVTPGERQGGLHGGGGGVCVRVLVTKCLFVTFAVKPEAYTELELHIIRTVTPINRGGCGFNDFGTKFMVSAIFIINSAYIDIF